MLVDANPSVDRAVAFLRRAQQSSGAWIDFRLRPGRADSWTTAYVGLRLSEARLAAADPALVAATEFLHAHRAPGGGWRYNRLCPVDADSTALACLFLARRMSPALPADFARLASFQSQSGGFTTYRFASAEHGWCRPHGEVTATALRALSLVLSPDHDRLRRGRAWLRTAPEACRPYWWASSAYLDLELVRLGLPATRNRMGGRDRKPFAVALALDLATRRNAADVAGQLAAHLCRVQRVDGSWSSTPILRVVDPKAQDRNGARFADSPIVADDRRLFTTATALAALARFARAQMRSSLTQEDHVHA